MLFQTRKFVPPAERIPPTMPLPPGGIQPTKTFVPTYKYVRVNLEALPEDERRIFAIHRTDVLFWMSMLAGVVFIRRGFIAGQAEVDLAYLGRRTLLPQDAARALRSGIILIQGGPRAEQISQTVSEVFDRPGYAERMVKLREKYHKTFRDRAAAFYAKRHRGLFMLPGKR